MPTKTRHVTAIIWAFACLSLVSHAHGTKPEADSIYTNAAYALAFGTQAPASLATSPLGLDALLQSHALALQVDQELADTVTQRAFVDAFGIAPGAPDAPTGAALIGATLYYEQMRSHRVWLSGNPDDRHAMMRRAYHWVLGRDAYPEEIEYWGNYPTLTFILLAGCLEDWARRNQPGLMVTSGTPTIAHHCPYLHAQRVSPSIASEIRKTIALLSPDSAANAILASGAESLTSSGGVAFIPTGSLMLREGLISEGLGALVGNSR
jgi:hypothetical protein